MALCCALTGATSNSKLAWEQGIAGGQYADDRFYHGPDSSFKTKRVQCLHQALRTSTKEEKAHAKCSTLCQEQITHRGYLVP